MPHSTRWGCAVAPLLPIRSRLVVLAFSKAESEPRTQATLNLRLTLGVSLGQRRERPTWNAMT